MNTPEKLILLALVELGPASFEQVSNLTRIDNAYLFLWLEELIDRGFVVRQGTNYALAQEFRDHIAELIQA